MSETGSLWAGRVPRALLARLYRADAEGLVDEDLIDEVGMALLLRCESILTVSRAHNGPPICPRCRTVMDDAGGLARCAACDWEISAADYHKTYKGKHLHAGRMEPFLEAFAEEYPRARTAADKMFLIDVLIHRCHGDFEQRSDRSGAINLIGGRPREVAEFLDELGGFGGVTRRRRLTKKPGWRRSGANARRDGGECQPRPACSRQFPEKDAETGG